MKRYVDKYIAHLDSDRSDIELPKISEGHQAVLAIYQLYHRWFQIVTGSALVPPDPVPWEYIFTVPWLSKDRAAEISDRRRSEIREEMRELVVTT